jgi:hypothetical protein
MRNNRAPSDHIDFCDVGRGAAPGGVKRQPSTLADDLDKHFDCAAGYGEEFRASTTAAHSVEATDTAL